MKKFFEATGDTIEIAYRKACETLGVSTEKAICEVLEEPVKKTFGLFGGSPAKVRATYVLTPVEKACDYIRKILTNMELTSFDLEVKENEDSAEIKIVGDDISFIIGHRGDTLDSIQYLTSLVANQDEESYYRISLDVGNFREKRKETLENLGKKIASKAIKYGRNQKLEPMNPYERRIIHFAVQDIEEVKSWSEGEDMLRHVVIGPVDGERPSYNRNNNRFAGRNNNRNNVRKPSGSNVGYKNNNRPERQPKINVMDEPVPKKPAPVAVPMETTQSVRKKIEDAPLYGRIK